MRINLFGLGYLSKLCVMICSQFRNGRCSIKLWIKKLLVHVIRSKLSLWYGKESLMTELESQWGHSSDDEISNSVKKETELSQCYSTYLVVGGKGW